MVAHGRTSDIGGPGWRVRDGNRRDGVDESDPRADRPHAAVSQTTSGTGRNLAPPNIVFVLTDDLSMNLIRFMPQVQALEARGLTFDNYFVSDSLCCPSRSSIFTGNFPHDTGVFENTGPDGGISAFYAHGDENHTFNVALQAAGYRTAMMGKYLNGYLQGPARSPVPSTYVPPGWDQWDVAGWSSVDRALCGGAGARRPRERARDIQDGQSSVGRAPPSPAQRRHPAEATTGIEPRPPIGVTAHPQPSWAAPAKTLLLFRNRSRRRWTGYVSAGVVR